MLHRLSSVAILTLFILFVLLPNRQWLPPEKIEPLGTSVENDNAKIALAGSSKRSVKEAYTRAKQWLRRRNRHSKSSRANSDTEGDMESAAAGGDGDDGGEMDIDVD